MMQEKPMNVDEIYLKALELPSGRERTAFLDQACATSSELRERVERLLRAQPHVESFLESAAAAFTPTITEPSILEKAGAVIGPYKLLQQIGEGGMGTVFMAEQTRPVQRKVALKVVKAGMDSHQVIARFEAERQALAMMDHVKSPVSSTRGPRTLVGHISSWSWSTASPSRSTATTTI